MACRLALVLTCLMLAGCGAPVAGGDAGPLGDGGADAGGNSGADGGANDGGIDGGAMDSGADAGTGDGGGASDAGDAGNAGDALPALQVARGAAAVAGISSGGFMAVQLHFAFSQTFQRGAAIFAGGPYGCAEGSVGVALTSCEHDAPLLNVPALEAGAAVLEAQGAIDPLANLAGAQVWLWSGTLDDIVAPPVVDALRSEYLHFGASVTYRNTTAAGHAWISPDVATACATEASPYINSCGVDAEEDLLGALFGPLRPRRTGALQGSIVAFDQNRFFDDGNAAAHSLGPRGFLFVPAVCRTQQCQLLVALHGCDQSVPQIGQTFVESAGLNEWADTNGLLVLYPQATASLANPKACWDWWGFDDLNYLRRTGRQMTAIKRMVERVSGR